MSSNQTDELIKFSRPEALESLRYLQKFLNDVERNLNSDDHKEFTSALVTLTVICDFWAHGMQPAISRKIVG